MRLTKLGVELTRTQNLGDYSSIKVGGTAWVDFDPGDDPAQAFEALRAYLRNHIAVELARVVPQLDRKLQGMELFMGLPVDVRDDVTIHLDDDIGNLDDAVAAHAAAQRELEALEQDSNTPQAELDLVRGIVQASAERVDAFKRIHAAGGFAAAQGGRHAH